MLSQERRRAVSMVSSVYLSCWCCHRREGMQCPWSRQYKCHVRVVTGEKACSVHGLVSINVMFVLSQERRRAVSMVTESSGTPLPAVWRETQRSNPTPESNSYARDVSGRQVFCMMQSVKDCYDSWHNDMAQWYRSLPTVRNVRLYCNDTEYKIFEDQGHQLNVFLI